MKTLRNLVVAIILVVVALAITQPASAQSLEIRSLLSDRGWHGAGGTVQVHQPTLEASLPWVGAWERSARGERYGDWMYVKVLINCEQWSQIPFATLDSDYNFVLMADITGDDPVSRWPEPGSEPYRTMTSICALFGYQRQREVRVAPIGDYVER